MKIFKVLGQDMESFNGYKWALNEWKEDSGVGTVTGHGWFHAYTTPMLAAFLQPIQYSRIKGVLLFEGEADGEIKIFGGKVSATRMRITMEIPMPVLTREQCAKIALMAAAAACEDSYFREWAVRWLGGEDRTNFQLARVAAVRGRCEAAKLAVQTAIYFVSGVKDTHWIAARTAWYAVVDAHVDLDAVIQKAMEK